MSVTVTEIYKLIDKIAPFNTRYPFDNVGILVGDAAASVKRIAVCLDITRDVVKRAADNECDLIVSHHPVIFDKLSSVTAESIPYLLIKEGITAICAHTNLDCAKGKSLEIQSTTVFSREDASALNCLTERAHVGVSRLGNMFSTTFFPLNDERFTSFISLSVAKKSGAITPTSGI